MGTSGRKGTIASGTEPRRRLPPIFLSKECQSQILRAIAGNAEPDGALCLPDEKGATKGPPPPASPKRKPRRQWVGRTAAAYRPTVRRRTRIPSRRSRRKRLPCPSPQRKRSPRNHERRRPSRSFRRLVRYPLSVEMAFLIVRWPIKYSRCLRPLRIPLDGPHHVGDSNPRKMDAF